MCWIGRRKGRLGGNPGSVTKAEGDLPSAIETGAQGRKNLIAVLTGSARAGQRRGNPQAPWKSRRDLAGLPTPEASSVPRGQSQQAELPKWIKVDGHLTYMSRSSGKMMEVVVEMINSAKREVEITFVEDSKIWKVLPFNLLASNQSPLLGPWTSGNNGTPRSSTTASSAGAASSPCSTDGVLASAEAGSNAAAAATVQAPDSGRPPGSSAEEAVREAGTRGCESHSRSRSPRGRGVSD